MTDGLVQTTAYELDSKVKDLKKNINSGFLELAKYLKEIRDEQLYKDLDYGTFESYIAQPELSFSRQNVYRIIQIYEKFVLELGISEERLSNTEWTKVREILPYVNEQNKEELLTKVETLSRSDLALEIANVAPGRQTEPEDTSKEETVEIVPLYDSYNKLLSEEKVYPFKQVYENQTYINTTKIFKRLSTFDPRTGSMFIALNRQPDDTFRLEVKSDMPIPSNQSKQPSCPNKEEGHKGCIQFIDSLAASRGVKFPNYPKQIGALHKILKAGYTWGQINKQVDKMEANTFWKDKGFDISNLANELGRGGGN